MTSPSPPVLVSRCPFQFRFRAVGASTSHPDCGSGNGGCPGWAGWEWGPNVLRTQIRFQRKKEGHWKMPGVRKGLWRERCFRDRRRGGENIEHNEDLPRTTGEQYTERARVKLCH